jgi:transposase
MDDEQAAIERGEALGSIPRSSRKSARPQRIEVITRGGRRRWSIDKKREIVAESLAPGAMSSEVIRKHGITSGQLYTWRRQVATRVGRELARPEASFARVDVVAALGQPDEADLTDDTAQASAASVRVAAPLSSASRGEGLIEIVLPGGVLVRVDGRVDTRALRHVLDVFAKR